MSLIDLSAYLWPEDVTGRLPSAGRRFDPTNRLNSNTTYTLYGGELYGPNNQSLAVPPLESGLTVGLGAGGIGLTNSGASVNGLNYGLPGRYLSDTGVVFHVTTTVTLTGNSSICSVWGSAPEHYQHVFSVGADGSIVFGIYNDYSNVHIKSVPAGTVPMGRATTISAYWQAGVGILIAVDGKLCTSYSNVWVQGDPLSVAWSGQCWGGKLKIFAGASGTLHYLKIQNGVRTAKDLIEISRNPNDLFEPLPDLPFSLSAAGGGTTTVTSDSTASYKVQGSVQSSSVAAYGIRSAIQSDSAVSYAIRASAQNDAASSYTVRGLIQQSSTLAYAIRGLVDQAVAVNYSIRSAVSSDATSTYNILSATSVSSSTSAGYNIRGSINQDTAAIYALRGSVTQDTSATYSILSATSVTASVTAGYAIKGSVQSSIVAGFSIAQAVQAEIAASYIIRAGVVSEAQAAYVIRGLVQQSIAASYAIDGTAFSGSISDADIARIVQAVLAALNNESIAAAVWAHATRVITGPTANDNADALLARAWP